MALKWRRWGRRNFSSKRCLIFPSSKSIPAFFICWYTTTAFLSFEWQYIFSCDSNYQN